MRPKAWLKARVKSGQLTVSDNASNCWVDYEPAPGYQLVYRGEVQELIAISPTGQIVLASSGKVSKAKTAFQFEIRKLAVA